MVADMGARLVVDKLAWVEPEGRRIHTEQGADMSYDSLILAMGARRYERFEHATTIDDRRLDEQLHGLIQDVEMGYVRSVAFVIPPRMAWPLPIYELALMTARRAYDMGMRVAVTVVTPEASPLAVFGEGASRAMAALLAEAAIAVETSAEAEVPSPGHVRAGARQVDADRVIALPELNGPAVRGLASGPHGFLPVDRYCRVRGTDGIYVAGDAADFPVKHRGLAAQQADTAARSIAAAAGAPVEPRPFRPEIRGLLLTGAKPRYLSARLVGDRGFESEITDEPTWSPPTKIAAEHLAPFLAARDG